MIKYFFVSVIILLSILLTAGCNKSTPPPTEPPPPDAEPTIHLSLEGKTCTEAWFQLKVDDIISASVYKDDSLLANIQNSSIDTSFYQDNLLPNKSYTFKVTVEVEENKVFTKELSFQTLDTTSHNYIWQEYTFGGAGNFSNVLYDVWGTDENNIWAVGGVKINGTIYGALHWNGIEWIPDSTAGGYAIFGFNNNDIWIAGGAVFHYNGTKWRQIDAYSSNGQSIPLDQVLFNNRPYTSIWGTSSNNLYLGSERGKIVHWDGSRAKLVYSAASWILDIHGFDENSIMALVSDPNIDKDTYIFFDGTAWKELENKPVEFFYVKSVFMYDTKNYFIAGNAVFQRAFGRWVNHYPDFTYTVVKIRGNGVNNVFAIGHGYTVNHYNGINWHFYNELYDAGGGIITGLWVKENFVAMAGMNKDFSKGLVIIGRRDQLK